MLHPQITNPLQRRVLESIASLNTLLCDAQTAGNAELLAAAEAAEKHLTVWISYAEGPLGENGIAEGEPLPWREPSPSAVAPSHPEGLNIWVVPRAEAARVKLYPGEYVALVAFVRSYGDDCEALDSSARHRDGATPDRLAQLLNAEIQEAADCHGGPAGRWQVLAVDAPKVAA